MKLTQVEMVFLGGSIAYVAFFTHPPPQFVQQVLSTPWGHGAALLAILVVALNVSHLAALFVGIAYILSSNPTLEYFEEKKEKEKEQPKSGAPEPDLKGLAGKIMAMQGKEVTKPPMPSSVPKPASPDTKDKTEHYSNFSAY